MEPSTGAGELKENPPDELKRSGSLLSRVEIVDAGGLQKQVTYSIGDKTKTVCRKSLFIFPIDTLVRKTIISIVEYKWFDRFILGCIVINSIMLGVYQHRATPDEDHYWINEFIDGAGDMILWTVFCVECVLKIIAWGLILGENTYLRDAWNILDFVVVVSGLIEMLPFLEAGGSLGVLRLFRLLRPLRSLNAVPQLKILVNTLLRSMLKLGNVIVLGAFLFMVFSIIGIQLMNGIFYRQCHVARYPELNTAGTCWLWPVAGDERICGGNYMCEDTDGFCGGHEEDSKEEFNPFPATKMEDSTFNAYPGDGMAGKPWCDGSEPTKINPETDFVHFDHVFAAILLIFQSMTLEGWTDLMYYVEDAFSPWFAVLYFFTVVIFTNFFMLNVALAVVDEVQDDLQQEEEAKIAAEKEKQLEEGDATSDKAWEENDAVADILDDDDDEEEKPPWTDCAPVRACLKVATSNDFGNFIMAIIAGNVVNMCLGWFTITDRFGYAGLDDAIDVIEKIFLGIFVIEMGINITAFGPKGYVTNPVTAFDGFVVIISVTETVMKLASDGGGGGLSVLRTFRLFRVMNKLANKWTKLKVLLKAMLKTGMALNYWLVLFGLVLYIFTLMWISIFAKQFHFNDPDSFDALEDAKHAGEPWCADTESLGNTHSDKWTYRQDCIPRAHFDTFIWGFVTIFQVMTGENWNTIMYAGMRASQRWEGTLIPPTVLAAGLFIVLILFGQTLFLSLFLSMLISKFDEVSDEIEIDEKKKSIRLTQIQSKRVLNVPLINEQSPAKKSWPAKMFSSNNKVAPEEAGPPAVMPGQVPTPPDDDNLPAKSTEPKIHPEEQATYQRTPSEQENFKESQKDDDDMHKDFVEMYELAGKKVWPEGYAWFILSEKNPVRRFAKYLLEKSITIKDVKIGVFDNFVLLCILLSTLCMMIDTPMSDPSWTLTMIVRTMDKTFAVIFIVEMSIKLTALGFIWGKDAYLTSVWNWLDGIVVMVSIIDFVTQGGGPSFLRVLRILRTFRPLRVISRNEGLKVVVETVVKSMADLFGLVIVSLLFLLIFAMIFLLLLKGQLFACSAPESHDVGYHMSKGLGEDFVTPLCLGTTVTQGDVGSAPRGVFDSSTEKWQESSCGGDFPNFWQRASADTPICVATCNSNLDEHPSAISALCHRKYVEVEELPSLCTDPARVVSAKELIGVQYIADQQRTLVVPCGGNQVKDGVVNTDAAGVSCMKNFCPGQEIGESCKSECESNRQRLGFCYDICKVDKTSAACSACRGECEAACQCEEFCTPLIFDAALCKEQGGEWGQVLSQDFDNIINSMLTLFEIGTTEGWVDVMYAASDSMGLYRQPQRDAGHYIYVILFPLWILLYFMFLINLAVGIIVDTFMDLKESKGGGGIMMTDTQKKWVNSRRGLVGRSKFFDLQNLDQLAPMRLNVYRVIASKQFEQFIMTCIVTNTVVMACTIFPAPTNWWEASQTVANYMFAFIYTVEACLKLFALRGKYWNNSWNRFDFTCVVATLAGILLDRLFNIDLGAVTSVIRILRIARLFRLLQFLKELNRLFMCLLISIPKLFNVTLVLLLFLILFSILGMNVFGTAKLHETLGPHGNFHTFFRSFVTLFRASTGEAWNEIMHDLMKDEEAWFRMGSWCTPQTLFKSTIPEFYTVLREKCLIPQEPGDTGPNACSGSWNPMPAMYWVAFTLLITFMIINLVVAVILEGYEEGKENEEVNNIEVCIAKWKQFDPNQTYQISLQNSLRFMNAVLDELAKNPDHERLPDVKGNTLKDMEAALPMRIAKFFDLNTIENDGENQVEFTVAAKNALKFLVMGNMTEDALRQIETCEDNMSKKDLEKLRKMEKPGPGASLTVPGMDMRRNLAALKLQTKFRQREEDKQAAGEQIDDVTACSPSDPVCVRPPSGQGSRMPNDSLREAADCDPSGKASVSPPRAG